MRLRWRVEGDGERMRRRMTSDLITSLPVVGLGGLLVVLVRLTHHLRENYMGGGMGEES